MSKRFDDSDKLILNLLQNNAKMSIRDISKRINLSPTSVRQRIKRLEKKVIKKYIALIDCKKLGIKKTIFISIKVKTKSLIESIKEELKLVPEIKFSYFITGNYPIFIMAKCLNYKNILLLIKRLRTIPGVEELKTELILEEISEDPTISF
jgi:Lrp/AsnC family leucine-responsive transcriptional regulator